MELLRLDATRRRAELWRREDERSWTVRDVIGAGTLRFAALDVDIPLADLYEGIP